MSGLGALRTVAAMLSLGGGEVPRTSSGFAERLFGRSRRQKYQAGPSPVKIPIRKRTFLCQWEMPTADPKITTTARYRKHLFSHKGVCLRCGVMK